MALNEGTMPSEGPYRFALLLILILTATMMAYHRIRAAKSGERISHKEEGILFFAALRHDWAVHVGWHIRLSHRANLDAMGHPVFASMASLVRSNCQRRVFRFDVLDADQPGKESDRHGSDQNQRHIGDDWPVPFRSSPILCQHGSADLLASHC